MLVRDPVPVLSRELSEWTALVADLIGLALIGLWLVGFVQRNALHQGDLMAYRFAGQAALGGMDPYVPANLAELAGRRVFPFLYPPIALLPCMAIAHLPFKVIAYKWMWTKIGVLGVLIFGWSRLLKKRLMVLPLALAAFFAWNSSAQWDLVAGNIAIVEAGMIWLALAAFMRGRRGIFATLIVGVAIFKVAPIAFLLLLLVPVGSRRPRPWVFVGSAGTAVLLIVLPMLVGPAAHFQHFWAEIPNWTVYGVENPSVIGLVATLVASLPLHGISPAQVGLAAWCLYAVSLLFMSARFLRHCYRARNARQWAAVAVALYVLLMPRPMAYGFVMLTPAVLWLAPGPFKSRLGRLILALVISAQGLFRVTFIVSRLPFVPYTPLIFALCIWLLVLDQHHSDVQGSARQNAVEIGELKAA